MKYEVQSHLLGPLPDSGERKVFKPGDIVTETDLKDGGFKDLDSLRNVKSSANYKPGFAPSIKAIRGTEAADDADSKSK